MVWSCTDSNSKQTFLTQNASSFKSNVFFLDLFQALIGANIPWNKLVILTSVAFLKSIVTGIFPMNQL